MIRIRIFIIRWMNRWMNSTPFFWTQFSKSWREIGLLKFAPSFPIFISWRLIKRLKNWRKMIFYDYDDSTILFHRNGEKWLVHIILKLYYTEIYDSLKLVQRNEEFFEWNIGFGRVLLQRVSWWEKLS